MIRKIKLLITVPFLMLVLTHIVRSTSPRQRFVYRRSRFLIEDEIPLTQPSQDSGEYHALYDPNIDSDQGNSMTRSFDENQYMREARYLGSGSVRVTRRVRECLPGQSSNPHSRVPSPDVSSSSRNRNYQRSASFQAPGEQVRRVSRRQDTSSNWSNHAVVNHSLEQSFEALRIYEESRQGGHQHGNMIESHTNDGSFDDVLSNGSTSSEDEALLSMTQIAPR